MTRKARIWIGMTLLSVLVLNYIVIGIPLYRNKTSLNNNIQAMMIKQAKSGHILNNSEDAYIIEVLKKEAMRISRKMTIVNCVAASAAIIITSWVIFGLIVFRKEKDPNHKRRGYPCL